MILNFKPELQEGTVSFVLVVPVLVGEEGSDADLDEIGGIAVGLPSTSDRVGPRSAPTAA